MDHSIPTTDRSLPFKDAQAQKQIQTLEANVKEHGITFFGLDSGHQGIIHVIGPELGLTLPGMTIVCGDSRTATHGAFGALAFGIGTSEIERVFTQCLLQYPNKTMAIEVEGVLQPGVTAKDVILAIIAEIGVGGGTGYVLEYRGSAIRSLSMEGRMTLCNMSIEAGARAGLVAPDRVTFGIFGTFPTPKGEAFEKALEDWKQLQSDEGARFDKVVRLDAASIEPMVTYGVNPAMGTGISQNVPRPEEFSSETEAKELREALDYMGLKPGQTLKGLLWMWFL